MESSLAYHEPSVTTIAILAGFLLLLNIVNFVLDKLIYCGLIGQVLLGIAWGTPGAKWLSREMEEAAMQLGFLGLLLIVYEGGLATSFKSLKANILLSTGVAITGIAAPMGLSFILLPMVGASSLQAFAAGAALCSTSLGTTFTILGTSGLSATRLGVVLTCAAMMDDVVGLIMVQVISNLGGDDFNAITVVRPVLVSIGFAVIAPLACRFIVQPLTLYLNAMREKDREGRLNKLMCHQQAAFVIHTVILLALVIGGTYAGTSGLFAAYIAGASISWWDSELPHLTAEVPAQEAGETVLKSPPGEQPSKESSASTEQTREQYHTTAEPASSGMEVYEAYYKTIVEHLLKPFFFASIGFSIPVTRMFSGAVVWRGVVYAVLMTLAKIVCGIWLISFVTPMHAVQKVIRSVSVFGKSKAKGLAPGKQCAGPSPGNQDTPSTRAPNASSAVLETSAVSKNASMTPKNASPDPEMPVSLYPACILACAMVARGEIGFLISALAEGNGIFGRQAGTGAQPSEMFLIITWAISLCTIGGPICVGLLVSRVKKLEAGRPTREKRDVLGVWGVS